MAKVIPLTQIDKPSMEGISIEVFANRCIDYVGKAVEVLRESYRDNDIKMNPPVGKVIAFRCGDSVAFYMVGAIKPASLIFLPIFSGYRLAPEMEAKISREHVIEASPVDLQVEADSWLFNRHLFITPPREKRRFVRRFARRACG